MTALGMGQGAAVQRESHASPLLPCLPIELIDAAGIGKIRIHLPAQITERIMRRQLHNDFLAACFTPTIAMVLALLMTLRLPVPAAAEAQKDTNACLRTSNALYKRGEELHKKRRWQIPREFGRVAANLDDYCRAKEFKKADIAIDWLNTCLRNYDKPANQEYCTLGKKYLCAIDADSEACRTAS